MQVPVIVSTWSWGHTACKAAGEALAAGRGIADAVEAGTVAVELDPEVMTVGYGGLPNAEGQVEVDAMFMVGSRLEVGAVAALRGVRTPIRVARRVSAATHHVLLAGEGARRFATEQGFGIEDMHTPASLARYARWQREGGSRFRRGHADDHDTVCVLGTDGVECVAAVSTSGLGFKLPGRVGDSPLVGAGGYADAEVGAAAATGVGEEVMRSVASFAVVEKMRAGAHPDEAIEAVLRQLVRRRGDALRARESQVALIAVRRDGVVGCGALYEGFVAPTLRAGAITGMRPKRPLLVADGPRTDPADRG